MIAYATLRTPNSTAIFRPRSVSRRLSSKLHRSIKVGIASKWYFKTSDDRWSTLRISEISFGPEASSASRRFFGPSSVKSSVNVFDSTGEVCDVGRDLRNM